MINICQLTDLQRSKGPKGIGMIFVIAITGVVSLIVGLMMSKYITHTRSIRTLKQKIQSFYTAEAGIKKAFYYLKEDEEKGIEWRTGSIIQNIPIKQKIFYDKNDEVSISVVDDCGFLRIRSQTVGGPRKAVEVLVVGIVPDNLKNNLYLVSSKPLILNSGSSLKGKIKLNHEPIFQGGSIDGVLETNSSLSLPPLITKTFTNSINYFRYLLSTPDNFAVELFAPQIVSPEQPLPAREVFVNDVVLIENSNYDTIWNAGSNVKIASTADVQISGSTKINDACIVAIGSVKILDNACVKSSKIYSESSIELRKDATFSGVLIAPEIEIAERAQLFEPTIIYGGLPFKRCKMIFSNRLPIYCNIINLCTAKSFVEITENTQIEGFVYSHAPIVLKGEINGFVYCQSFQESPVTGGDTTNNNIICGTIRPPDSAKSISIPVVSADVRDFKVIKRLEF